MEKEKTEVKLKEDTNKDLRIQTKKIEGSILAILKRFDTYVDIHISHLLYVPMIVTLG